MIHINLKEIEVCSGGKGECRCWGTNTPEEMLRGAFLIRTGDEAACRDWCIEGKKGKYYSFTTDNALKSLTFFGRWFGCYY